MRHGERTSSIHTLADPAQFYDCTMRRHHEYEEVLFSIVYDDPPTYGPEKGACGYMMLTEAGWLNHRARGAQRTRKRYIEEYGLLKDRLADSRIDLHVTNSQRTLESLEAHLSGVWPEIRDESATIPITTTEMAFEMKQAGGFAFGVCPRFDVAAKRTFRENYNPEYERKLDLPCLAQNGTLCGKDYGANQDQAWDSVHGRRVQKKPLVPFRGGTSYVDAATEAAGHLCSVVFSDREYTRGVAGRQLRVQLQQVLDVMDRAARGEAQPSDVSFTVTHDTYIMPIIGALQGHYGTVWAPLAATIELVAQQRGEEMRLIGFYENEPLQFFTGNEYLTRKEVESLSQSFGLSQEEWAAWCLSDPSTQ